MKKIMIFILFFMLAFSVSSYDKIINWDYKELDSEKIIFDGKVFKAAEDATCD